MQQESSSRRLHSRWQRRLIIGGVALVVLIAIGTAVLVRFGPLTASAVTRNLEETVGGKVTIGRFHSEYFPRPGCVLEGLASSGNGAAGNAVSIRAGKLTVEVGFLDLFRNSIDKVQADDLRVTVPQGSGLYSSHAGFANPGRWVRELVADGAVVEFERRGRPGNPLRFDIHRLTLSESGRNAPIHFRAELLNPEPPGEISTDGQFGPWRPEDPGQTAVAGTYAFKQARLDVFKGIAGTLSSQGEFSGVLGHIEVRGRTETPDFEVKQIGHRVHLNTEFRATVNGTNGDTFLQPVSVSIDRTEIQSQASVRKTSGEKGKLTTLEASGRGRIQDLLRLFVSENPPAMTGEISLKAFATLPSGPRPFLRKLRVQGDFTIGEVRFSKPATEQNLDQFSARAQGKKPGKNPDSAVVPGTTQGHVVVEDGVATFSNLTFGIPGATAQLHGTFNLLDQRVNLEGVLKTEASLSHSTSGIKSVLLKPLDPFFKKKHAGAAVGISLTGTYDHPSFGLDLDAHK